MYGEYQIYNYSEYYFDASKNIALYSMIFFMSNQDMQQVTFWYNTLHTYYFQIIDNELVLDSVINRDGEEMCNKKCNGLMYIEELYIRVLIYTELEHHYSH